MKRIPLNKKVLESRLSEIRTDLEKLETLRKITLENFLAGENFAIAEHYLRRALESIFDIGNHILSRLPIPPGERPSTYKEIAIALGKYKVLSNEFAKGPLFQIAGYRTRMVHFYFEITKEELYGILQKDLKDIETFCKFIYKLIKNPKRLNLEIK